ncbi:hypothetical protein [Simkania sp.]|uniref:hypothetical protein n=1 Tax=Simkania sp. TaxID=34094 RepID=UPI003B52D725
MKKLLIALCLGLFSLTQMVQGSEKTYTYDESKDLVEIRYLKGYRAPGEILVNLMCVEGLCFEEEFSFGKVKDGWQCKLSCHLLESQMVYQDEKLLEHMEVLITATNLEEPGKIEVLVNLSSRFVDKVDEEGIVSQVNQRRTITSTVTCPDLSLSEKPMYYCHDEIGSDVSIGFVHQ